MRRIRFVKQADKARWLDAAARLDATDPRIYEAAMDWGGIGSDREVAERLFAAIRDRIRYAPDEAQGARQEVLADSATVIGRGWDDCDGKARALVALALARGIPARIVACWLGREFAHVAAELRIAGRWIHADPTLRRAALGQSWREVPKERDGRWLT